MAGVYCIELFLLDEMTEQQGQGEGDARADENVAKRVAHFLFSRRLTKLIKEGVLVGCGGSFTAFPFADRDGMDARQLRKLDLVKAELLPQMLNLR